MKKIVVAALRQESNSFSPVKSTDRDFIVARAEEMLQRIAVTELFREEGYRILPVLYAYAVPGGMLEKESYLRLKNEILEGIPADDGIAGVWLYLHGALEVEGVGSGDAVLVSEIRKKVGEKIPIAVALDFHANISQELVDSANIICGYRTAPHTDEEDTQRKAGAILLRSIKKGTLPRALMERCPLLLPGEMMTTGVEPVRSLMMEVEAAEREGDILCASFFCGMAWVDSPNSGASVVVVTENDITGASGKAKHLSGLFFEARERYHFEEEAMEPEEALKQASASAEGPVFITDTGDNVTAGAPGDNAQYLGMILKSKPGRVLLAGIKDGRAVAACSGLARGSAVSLMLGGEIDPQGESVYISGLIKNKGVISDNYGKVLTKSVVLAVNDVDVIITEKRCAITSPAMIESLGLSISDYKIVVVKQGYLFDGLRQVSKRSIIALTTGVGCLDIEKLSYKKIKRPIYLLDKKFIGQ